MCVCVCGTGKGETAATGVYHKSLWCTGDRGNVIFTHKHLMGHIQCSWYTVHDPVRKWILGCTHARTHTGARTHTHKSTMHVVIGLFTLAQLRGSLIYISTRIHLHYNSVSQPVFKDFLRGLRIYLRGHMMFARMRKQNFFFLLQVWHFFPDELLHNITYLGHYKSFK